MNNQTGVVDVNHSALTDFWNNYGPITCHRYRETLLPMESSIVLYLAVRTSITSKAVASTIFFVANLK